MSHFECRLNRRFCAQKMVQVIQIGGRGGGNLDIQHPKEQLLFFRETFPNIQKRIEKIDAFMRLYRRILYVDDFHFF